MADIGFEPVAVDRPVQHHRRDHATEPQACDQRRGLSVAVREAHAQPRAALAAPMAACHVGRGPGLINEDEPLGVEVRLSVKPGAPLAQNVRSILLDGVAGLFFRVIPRRWKNRESPDLDVAIPRAASRWRNSTSVWSRSSSKAAITSPPRASMRRERMSPPCVFGAKPPVARRAASQRMTDDTETPKRPAAARRLMPVSTAAKARARRPIESGLPIPKPNTCSGWTEPRFSPDGNPLATHDAREPL